jgi:hypothetical protein
LSVRLKKEASVVGGIKGFSAPFGAKKKNRKPKKKNPSKPYGEPELFEMVIAESMLDDDVEEVVKKVGSNWVYFDDDNPKVSKGTFSSREAAWERQRRDRLVSKTKKERGKTERQRQIQSLEPTKAKKASVEKGPAQTKRKEKSKKKHEKSRHRKLENIFRKVLSSSVSKLTEGRGMVSYVFEQTPISEESKVWDEFVSRLSKDVIRSDQKLRNIMKSAEKAEGLLLKKAVGVVSNILSSAGGMTVLPGSVEKDPVGGEIFMAFQVQLEEDGKKKLKFGVCLEHGKPVVVFPEDTREALKAMGTDSSKLLRAELMHAQETALDNMDDALKASSKRDIYLSKMSEKIEKTLGSMGPLELAMLKHILKRNYRGVK